MNGKEKCKALKEIRKKIAEENDIHLVIAECTHKGDCKGTCPRCEAEVAYLEKQLALRAQLGKAAVIAGIATSVCGSLTACSPTTVIESVSDILRGPQATTGVMPAPTDEYELAGDAEIDVNYLPESTDEDSSVESTDAIDDNCTSGTDDIEDVDGLLAPIDIETELEGELIFDPSCMENPDGECNDVPETSEAN